MNREEIVRLAKKADIRLPNGPFPALGSFDLPELISFASLVAAAEREACARICDAEQQKNEDNGAFMWEAKNCAAAIRARSNT